MAGHSKWAQIKRAKGANDAKRGAVFTRLAKAISLAAKNGKDPEMNPALRTAIDTAKAANMPKDNIERAILRGAGELPGQMIEELIYEAYGPFGVAIMLQCATDNINRTASSIKQILSKRQGKLGGPGSVSYLFTATGIIRCKDNSEDTQLKAMDAGAHDIQEEDNSLIIYVQPNQLETAKVLLGDVVEFTEIALLPATTINLNDQQEATIERLLEDLEDNEDVIEIYHNAKLKDNTRD